MTSLIWLFATRDDGPHPGQDGSGMWRREDQGQDCQAPVGTPILAVASGRIRYYHDPSGFGSTYPVLLLDSPIDGVPALYFGHVAPEVGEVHVEQGQVIGHCQQRSGGNASNLPGWVELGPWNNGPTGNGRWMHDHLLNAPVYSPNPQPSSSTMENPMPRTILDPKALPDASGRQPCWLVHADGSIYCWDGARQLRSLAQIDPGHVPIADVQVHPSGDGVILFGNDGHYDQAAGEWARSSYTVLVGT